MLRPYTSSLILASARVPYRLRAGRPWHLRRGAI